MKAKNTYILAISKLREGEQKLNFTLENDFFAKLEQTLLEKGSFEVNLHLTKSDTMLQLDFQISGEAELICDRSLEPFNEQINTKQRLILKFGNEAEVINEEMEIIPWQMTEIDIRQYLYEFISLALPMKRLHPKFRETDEADPEAETTLVYSSQTEEMNEGEETTNIESDPRWEALKKLKNK